MVKYLGKAPADATAAWNNIPADPLFGCPDRGVRGRCGLERGELPAPPEYRGRL
jgi:hypothetical protein